ncbi:hypothetical protein DSM104299_01156 [Baekduia alba]|uniref:hypothetical protein n=1 Tax=Baekduia alba TaxID=2997333 RepID=UPI002340E7A4|nr:hypothetical protein [Baekduia alba]WCB92460.1 hypothetical protein DSM104299_01156 [Baekduia alba]
MSTSSRRGLVGLLAALLCLVGAASAQASADGPKLCAPGNTACVWFTNDGDVIHVQDVACDGHSAVAQVQIASLGIYDNLWNSDGCGTIRTYSYGTAVPEGTTVYYRPCIGEWGTRTLLSCNSGWTHGTA